ncbi:restriction endonuclease subunit S [Shewanella glacialipiscicola]|uniref:restriction endonuclease subunit S n=1 Tax=Shewanella glacialipiscicola TaxID=614069 RepID=UPI003D79DC9C
MSQISSQTVTSESAGQTIPDGYKQTDVGIIPVDWEVKKLATMLNESPRYGINAAAVPLIGNLPVYIRITDISIDGYFRPTEKVGVDNPLSDFYKLKKDDLVLARTGASVGKSYLYRESDGELVFAGFLIKVSPNTKILNAEYLSHYLKTDQYWSWIIVNSMRSGQPGVNGNEFGTFQIPVPAIKEQTAIANALSDVDALLNEIDKLIAKKQAIKTATMQQLLTGKTRLPQFAFHPEVADMAAQHNQALPEASATVIAADCKSRTNTSASATIKNNNNNTLAANNKSLQSRRKGTKQSELGEIPEDWEVVSLGDIGQTIIGLTYSPNDVYDCGSLVLRSSNVQNNNLAFENNVFVQMDLPERVIVKEADILICVRNGSRDLIGKCALIDSKTAGSAFGAFMSVYRTLASSFVFYQFQSDVIKNQINEIMGATINQITNKDMASFKIPIPKNNIEQAAIATVLSDMDEEIQALQQRLSKTRQIKQGMMQELLTGKTRLPFDKDTISEASV